MFRASRNSVSNNSVVGNEVNSTGRTRYRDTIKTMTEMRMSTTINRSSTNPGSGVISATTIASMAIGTTNWPSVSIGRSVIHFGRLPPDAGGAMVFEGVMLSRLPSVHQFEDVCQDLRHGSIKMRWNLLSDLDALVERLCQWRILDDRHLMLDRLLAYAQRQEVLALGDYQRRRHIVHVIAYGNCEMRRVDYHGCGRRHVFHHLAA